MCSLYILPCQAWLDTIIRQALPDESFITSVMRQGVRACACACCACVFVNGDSNKINEEMGSNWGFNWGFNYLYSENSTHIRTYVRTYVRICARTHASESSNFSILHKHPNLQRPTKFVGRNKNCRSEQNLSVETKFVGRNKICRSEQNLSVGTKFGVFAKCYK